MISFKQYLVLEGDITYDQLDALSNITSNYWDDLKDDEGNLPHHAVIRMLTKKIPKANWRSVWSHLKQPPGGDFPDVGQLEQLLTIDKASWSNYKDDDGRFLPGDLLSRIRKLSLKEKKSLIDKQGYYPSIETIDALMMFPKFTWKYWSTLQRPSSKEYIRASIIKELVHRKVKVDDWGKVAREIIQK